MYRLDAIIRSTIKHLKFTTGWFWSYVDTHANSILVSPAFATLAEAEAWRTQYLEAFKEQERAAEEAAKQAAIDAAKPPDAAA